MMLIEGVNGMLDGQKSPPSPSNNHGGRYGAGFPFRALCIRVCLYRGDLRREDVCEMVVVLVFCRAALG